MVDKASVMPSDSSDLVFWLLIVILTSLLYIIMQILYENIDLFLSHLFLCIWNSFVFVLMRNTIVVQAFTSLVLSQVLYTQVWFITNIREKYQCIL